MGDDARQAPYAATAGADDGAGAGDRPDGSDDAALIALSLRAPECFGALFDRHAPVIHRYIARRLGPDAADDLVAETFLVAFRRRERYDAGHADARPWLYGIATRLIGRQRRDEVRYFRAIARTGTDPAAEPLDDQVTDRIAAQAARRDLAAALAGLSQGQRDVLLLVASGLGYEQVARALDVPLGTMSSRLVRARRKVRLARPGGVPALGRRWRAWLSPVAAAVAVVGVVVGTQTVFSVLHFSVAPRNSLPGASVAGHHPGTGAAGMPVLYAPTGDGTVTPIVTTTNATLPPFKLALGATAAAFSPDGKTVYFLSRDVQPGQVSTVTPVRTATDTLLKPIAVGRANDMVMTPNGKSLYVTSVISGTVTPVRTATGTALPPIKVRGNPEAIAVTPDGSTVYAAGYGTGWVTPIRTATSTALPPIKVGGHLTDISVTPDGKTAYAVGGSKVTPIDTATNTALKPITVQQNSYGLVISPDGATAYVEATGDIHRPRLTVTPIRTATNTALPPIPTGSPASDTAPMVISPDGSTLYVLDDQGNDVIPIRTATNTPLAPIKSGTAPWALAITPNGKTLYVSNYDKALHTGVVTPVRTATNTALPPIEVASSWLAMSR